MSKVNLNIEQIKSLMRNMVITHGKEAAVKWLQEEWNNQPEAFFDAFIYGENHEG